MTSTMDQVTHARQAEEEATRPAVAEVAGPVVSGVAGPVAAEADEVAGVRPVAGELAGGPLAVGEVAGVRPVAGELAGGPLAVGEVAGVRPVAGEMACSQPAVGQGEPRAAGTRVTGSQAAGVRPAADEAVGGQPAVHGTVGAQPSPAGTQSPPSGTQPRPVPARPAVWSAIWTALGKVRDPELDEPLTDLGFVARCRVTDGEAYVRLRLPTYFCAPNFAFLMVADAYDAISSVPGVRRTTVELIDHFAADVINKGVAARAGFLGTFGGEAAGELHDLRRDFLRKAVLAGTDRLCRAMMAAGTPPARLAGLTLGDAPAGGDRERLRARRRELGLPHGDRDPLVIDPATGWGVGREELKRHLGIARLTRVGQEANSGVCRGMLRARYGQERTP